MNPDRFDTVIGLRMPFSMKILASIFICLLG
jgi:hypothetical protein